MKLDGKTDAWQSILPAARQGHVTLLFGARDVEHNNAAALMAYMEIRLIPGG